MVLVSGAVLIGDSYLCQLLCMGISLFHVPSNPCLDMKDGMCLIMGECGKGVMYQFEKAEKQTRSKSRLEPIKFSKYFSNQLIFDFQVSNENLTGKDIVFDC